MKRSVIRNGKVYLVPVRRVNAKRQRGLTVVVSGRINRRGGEVFDPIEYLKSHGYWEPVDMAPVKRKQVDYLAMYQSAPISAITHIAKVTKVRVLGHGKCRVHHDGKVRKLRRPVSGRVGYGVRGRMYVPLGRLFEAKTIRQLKG